jgi:hypothetical protein
MAVYDNGPSNVSVETVMPHILNGTKHEAVCTCGEDFRVLVTVDFAETTFDKQINNLGLYVICVCVCKKGI